MKVFQVTSDYVKNNMTDDSIYRVMLCDDTHGNTGKQHLSARLKPLKNLSIEDFNASVDDDNYAFVLITK